MAERDPYLTRGRAAGIGRYDGDPAVHAALSASGSTKQRAAYSTPAVGSDSGKLSAGRADRLVEEVRRKLLEDRLSDKFEQQEQDAAGPVAPGPGQPALHFHAQSVAVLVFVPWGVFVVVTVLFTLTRPATIWSGLAYAAVLAGTALAGILIAVHVALARGRIYLFLGILCLLAVMMGCAAGYALYDRDMAEYWLNKSRPSRSNVAPTDLAASYRDAAAIAFTDAARVDLHRVLGFRPQEDKLTYCVAPVLDEMQQEHVEFWAVGVDCCEPLWGFFCGDVLSPTARSGAVLPGEASAYTARRYERFRDAAYQAAALYGLTMAEKPIFLRWLEDPKSERARELRDGCVGIAVLCILYLLASVLLAAGLHWSSAGKPARAAAGSRLGVKGP